MTPLYLSMAYAQSVAGFDVGFDVDVDVSPHIIRYSVQLELLAYNQCTLRFDE